MMIISVREPERVIRLGSGLTKTLRGKLQYWKWMNDGKGVLSYRSKAANFEGAVVDQALRQITTLYPPPICSAGVSAIRRKEGEA